jgi:glutamate formiminotransferase
MDVDKIDDKNIVQLMANIINYLNVSLYQGQFTYNHE